MRLPDWQARLSAYILASWTRPLAPGQFDCMLFGAGGVEAVTGTDPAADFRGRYTTLKGGFRVLKNAGFLDHIACIDAHFARIPRAQAIGGDLAAVPGEDGTAAVGIVQGTLIYVLGPEGGLSLAPIEAALAVWEVR